MKHFWTINGKFYSSQQYFQMHVHGRIEINPGKTEKDGAIVSVGEVFLSSGDNHFRFESWD